MLDDKYEQMLIARLHVAVANGLAMSWYVMHHLLMNEVLVGVDDDIINSRYEYLLVVHM